ncbi:MAG TPA: hypothetical protein PLS03_01125 [Terrimicrobiaceae bacterium]|nr:hypothetical protein [Terrimicrobiaceae bacterium]
MTAHVVSVLQKAKPPVLRIAADGPRSHIPGEREKCLEARRIAQSLVNWPCIVETDFSDENLGCRKRVASAITSFLSDHEEGIILEDDCVPEVTFFPYCAELLARYRTNEEVMMICADSVVPTGRFRGESYRFSRIGLPWGWATWKRAWDLYRENMEGWDEWIASGAPEKFISHSGYRESLIKVMTDTRDGKVDTWDYQWIFSYWAANAVAVVPNTNLVSNIGFGPDATHTFSRADRCFARTTSPMVFPLTHPLSVHVAPDLETKVFRTFFEPPGILAKVQRLIRNSFRRMMIHR